MGVGLEAGIHRTGRGARGVLDQAGVEHVGEHQIDLQVHRRLEEASRQQRELKVLGAKDDPAPSRRECILINTAGEGSGEFEI